jgi:biotin carboxyl carrier protein
LLFTKALEYTFAGRIDVDRETLNTIMQALKGTSVAECEIEAKGGVIRLVRKPAEHQEPRHSEGAGQQPSAGAPVSEDSADEEETSGTFDVTSSWVGHFYRGTAKGQKACAQLRDVIKKDQQLGSVDVVNVFQKVTSPVAGMLVELLVEDGQAVEYGQPLFRLKVDEQETA